MVDEVTECSVGAISTRFSNIRICGEIVFGIKHVFIVIQGGSERLSVPPVHINATGNARNASARCVLPRIIRAAVCTDTVVLSNPTGPLVENARSEVICPPILVCIHTGGIAGRLDFIAELSRHAGKIPAPTQEVIILHIKVDRQVGHIAFCLQLVQQIKSMICLCSCLRRIGAIRIKIRSPRNTQTLALCHVALKLLILAISPVT